MALGTDLKFYASVEKGLKLKVRKFWRLIPTFAKVTKENLVGGSFYQIKKLRNHYTWAKTIGWKNNTRNCSPTTKNVQLPQR